MIKSKQLANAFYYASELNGEHIEIYCDVCGKDRIINIYHRLVECPVCARILHYLPRNRRPKFAENSVAL